MTVLSLVAKVKAAPGSRAQVRDALQALIAPTTAEEGCLAYVLHESQDDLDTFVFIEQWRSVPLWKRHMEAPHLQAFQSFAETHVAGWELLQLRPAAIADDDLAGRTPEQVFQHHAEALGAEDIDELMRDYDEHSVVMLPDRTCRGTAEIRSFFEDLLAKLPKARWSASTSYQGEVLFLQWQAESGLHRVTDGVDTFLFEHGMIRLQTARCTVTPVAALGAAA